MSALDEVLCHCPIDPDGHEPGSVLDCEAPPIRKGTYVSRSGTNGVEAVYGGGVRVAVTDRPGRDTIIPTYEGVNGFRHGALDARGTCPDCGKGGVRVKRHEVRTTDRPDLHDLHPGVVVAIRPALVEHKTPGRVGWPCSGGGKVPAETRYRSVALEKMVRDFGPESVA